MTRILTRSLEVSPDSIDENGHVNNQEYLRWMQDVAVEHSAALGWGMDRYLETGTTWVVRSHFVEYLRPAFQGDVLEASTWVADVQRRRSTRRYAFTRGPDRELVARAETLWVFVDARTGRPIPIPDPIRADFPVVDGAEITAELGIEFAHETAGRTAG
jgi:acyl-CoA thioester hydrolase